MRFLILGVDEGFKRIGPGNTDTIILAATARPEQNLVLMSIPRDLWIATSAWEGKPLAIIYTIGENEKTGHGPDAVAAVISKGFQFKVNFYLLFKMQGFIEIIDSLGGVDIVLSESVSSNSVGAKHFDGQAALAFTRDRSETDDFARMLQAQVMIKAIIHQL